MTTPSPTPLEHYPGIAGSVALVTGAAQGIGRTVARSLATHGARVAALDRNDVALKEAVQASKQDGLDIEPVVCDVADSAEVNQAVDAVESVLGPIEILVNVAGVLRLGELTQVPDADWLTTFAVNVHGTFFTSRAVGQRMAQRHRGSITTVASNAAVVPRLHMGAYCASKSAVVMLTRCLGLEFAEKGIRCNVVSPGSTDTPMLQAMWARGSSQRATVTGSLASYRVGIPLGKLATTGDVANAVLFLASDHAGHITMHNLSVDGGAALGA